MKRTLVVGLVAAALAVPLAGCGGGDDDSAATDTATTETTGTTTTDTETNPPAGGAALAGTVGPGFDISMSTNGAVAPGSYELTVEDLSSAHNFHLTGPGVDVSTTVAGEGTETFPVELEPGTYSFVCDPHATTMSGSFEVAG